MDMFGKNKKNAWFKHSPLVIHAKPLGRVIRLVEF